MYRKVGTAGLIVTIAFVTVAVSVACLFPSHMANLLLYVPNSAPV